MSATLSPSPLLRAALLIDAAASGGMGLLLTAGSGPLAGLTGLPHQLLIGAGLVCLAWSAIILWLGRRETLPSGWAWAVIALNAVWVVESALLLASGWVSPTTLGTAFVILQAALVAGFAEAQFIGLRRSRQAAPAAA